MERLHAPRLLDEHGHPLDPRIEEALRGLVPKFRRRYPGVVDEQELTAILEKAGQRIAAREQQSGPIERLHAYAWVALKHVAVSWMRLGSNRITQLSVGSEAGATVLARVPTKSGTPEEIEQRIWLREAMEHLTEDEWRVCNLKMLGYSGDEIARRRGSSTDAVNMVFSRATKKLRELLKARGVNVTSTAPGRRRR